MPVMTPVHAGRSFRPRRAARLALAAVATGVAALLLLRVATVARYDRAIRAPTDVPPGRVAVVFGAGVGISGEPTPPLHDRVATAAELYRLGKVERLLLSGDGRTVVLDEPAAMRRLALALGVPDTALLLDGGGLRTATSCHRARHEFGVRHAVLITQRFHLPRALLLCEAAGMNVVGVAGDRRTYPWRWTVSWHAREVVATALAWWDVARR